MARVCVTLKEPTYQKAAYLAKTDYRTLPGLIRHLLQKKIRDYEAIHGEIAVAEEELSHP